MRAVPIKTVLTFTHRRNMHEEQTVYLALPSTAAFRRARLCCAEGPTTSASSSPCWSMSRAAAELLGELRAWQSEALVGISRLTECWEQQHHMLLVTISFQVSVSSMIWGVFSNYGGCTRRDREERWRTGR